MRNTFIKYLTEQARFDKRIFVITPDLGFSVLEKFRDEFPDRFLNTGIAEQNAIGIAAGLALSGKLVYVYSITPFVTMRCFEQVRLDIAYMKTNVRLVGVGAGLSYGAAGATHHAIEDIAIMRALPNMVVCCPGDPIEVRELVRQSFNFNGPIYFRLGKNGEPNIHNKETDIKIGQAIKITEGDDMTLITTGNMLEQGYHWMRQLKEQGKSITLLSMPRDNIKGKTILDPEVIRPLDNPYSPKGGLAILKGNIAPDGSVVKEAALASEMHQHKGPARVF